MVNQVEMGSTLRMYDQYFPKRDDKGTWRIIDLHDQTLQFAHPDDEIPDNHPAITVLKEGEFIALVKEATRLGYIENAAIKSESSGIPQIKFEETMTRVSELEKENAELKQQLKFPQLSEKTRLQEHVLDILSRIALSANFDLNTK